MRAFMIATLVAAAATACLAQAAPAPVALPSGTILPVSLDRTLRSDHLRVGEPVRATVMQSIPGTRIHRGAHLLGRVVAVTPAPHPSITLRFSELAQRDITIPVVVSLRAMASLLEVEEAETPEDMAMRGTVPENATTRQIGGQQVYRGGGPVAEGMTPVGKPVAYGILALPLAWPGKSCRAQVAANLTPQAFWLFSSDACGLFGYAELSVRHAGRTTPAGQIVFTSTRHHFTLQSGSGLLLRVLPIAQSSTQSADSASLAALHRPAVLPAFAAR